MTGPDDGARPPVARTVDEAHTYMDLRPCDCGANRFERASRVVSQGADLISEYRGPCESCGTDREFRFRLPDGIEPGSDNRYGRGRSDLLDAGEWLFVADRMGAAVPRRIPADADERELAAHRLRTARDAVQQALNLTDSTGTLPPDALRSTLARQLLAQSPTRFEPGRLGAIKDAYAAELARYDG